MKTLNALLALMLMLPSFVYASQCSVKGQDNFTVSFDVEGDDEYQAVKLKQGSHGYVLWYTGYKEIIPITMTTCSMNSSSLMMLITTYRLLMRQAQIR